MRATIVAGLLVMLAAAPAAAERGRGGAVAGFRAGGFTTGGCTAGGFSGSGFSGTRNVTVFNRTDTFTSRSGGLATVTTTQRRNVFVDGGSRSAVVVSRVTTDSAGTVVSTSRQISSFVNPPRRTVIEPRVVVVNPNPSIVVLSRGNVVVSRAGLNGGAAPVVVSSPRSVIETGDVLGVVSSATLR